MSNISEINTTSLVELLQPCEEAIHQFEKRDFPPDERGNVVEAIGATFCRLASIHHSKRLLAETIQAAANSKNSLRSAALFLIRCLAVPRLLEDTAFVGAQFNHRAVDLIEKATPDLTDYFKVNEQKQTIDKIEVLRRIHSRSIELLSPLAHLPNSPDQFASRRQEVFKLLNNKFLKAYLNSYDFPHLANDIRGLMNQISDLLTTTDASFGDKLQRAIDETTNAIGIARFRQDFLAREGILPFLDSAKAALSEIERSSSERFQCFLRPKKEAGSLERRYRLHEPNQIVQISIPMFNDGPGMAVDTTIQFVSDSDKVLISSETINFGGVMPGDFSVSCSILIGEPITDLKLMIELKWRTARDLEQRANSFEISILGQNPNIDWSRLELLDPYSTEVAHGDEFVGRRAKVLALLNRIRKAHMQSSYITGQKRVGKTSLAFAVQDQLKSGSNHEIEIIYLEYGDYARQNAAETIEALGIAISQSLARFLPPHFALANLNFKGSLAPLNQIAQALSETNSTQKFLVVLDEFDEIHPEMYRFGSLAETFFSNLRTLSAKNNFALMLVGGENMPFIISAQGDQLNKFVREPLDYFSRSDEWDDFSNLVRQHGKTLLNWHESSLNEIFAHSNGHPYYTKLLCGRIFQKAVSDRDTEVTPEEVQKALTSLIENLDTNAFAHFWKDGIPQGREEAEAIDLKRRRLLVAIARARRLHKSLTVDSIEASRTGVGLSSGDIIPLLNDFCRRDVLRERGGAAGYEFVLPMFERWLIEKGVSKLIADTLGDEMAEVVQSAEDQAFVTGQEIAELIQGWSLYRGRRITSEDVRNWLQQVDSFRDQRLLFKLLQNLRFVTEEEAREKLRLAHSIVKQHTSPVIPETRSQRRYDLLVTYVDGPAKSGSRYADRYAEENLISVSCVVDPSNFVRRAVEHEEKRGLTINGVVIIDDIAATGQSLSENVREFLKEARKFLQDRSITLVILSLLATQEADEKIRELLKSISDTKVDFRTSEPLQKRHFAFNPENKIWKDQGESDRAKALVRRIGASIYKDAPLGFGDMGLLVTFYDTCPNNSLPLLHSHGVHGWEPLFPRAVN
jgi:hypothetical protein